MFSWRCKGRILQQNCPREIAKKDMEVGKVEDFKHKVLDKTLTHYEASEFVSDLYNYFLINNLKNLDLVFDLRIA